MGADAVFDNTSNGICIQREKAGESYEPEANTNIKKALFQKCVFAFLFFCFDKVKKIVVEV